MERLAAGADWHDKGWIFTRSAGRALDPEEDSRAFDKRVKRLDLTRITLHGLRHDERRSRLMRAFQRRSLPKGSGIQASSSLSTRTRTCRSGCRRARRRGSLVFSSESDSERTRAYSHVRASDPPQFLQRRATRL